METAWSDDHSGEKLTVTKRRWLCVCAIPNYIDYADDIAISQIPLPKPNPCCKVWNWQKMALASMGTQIKEYMRFNQKGDISTLNSGSLKLGNKFMYLEISVSSTESDITLRQAKEWTVIDRLLIIWQSNLFDKIKRNIFQGAVASIL